MGGVAHSGGQQPRTVLTETEQRILAIKIGEPKCTHGEIAVRLGMHRSTISTMINQDPLRRAIDDHLADIVETAKEYALSATVKAFDRLIQLIDEAESDNVKRLAARDLILILQKRGDSDQIGDEEWVSTVGQYGQIKTEKVRRIESESHDKEDETG